MTPESYHASRQFVDTPSGRIAYVERGSGPVALFVHGVFLNSYLWRESLEQLSDLRRCIAVDLLCHGHTETLPGADVSFAGNAAMLAQFIDALGVEQVDVVANDSGGGISQIFAAKNRDRIRSLALTNCDVHDNWPPEPFLPTVKLATSGQLGVMLSRMLANLDVARAALGVGYEHPDQIGDDALQTYLEPFKDSGRVADLERFFGAMDCEQTVAIESELQRIQAPTLIVWGTGDQFFETKWAYWLKRTIPGARPVIEIPGAKLFFPDERPTELVAELRKHWTGI